MIRTSIWPIFRARPLSPVSASAAAGVRRFFGPPVDRFGIVTPLSGERRWDCRGNGVKGESNPLLVQHVPIADREVVVLEWLDHGYIVFEDPGRLDFAGAELLRDPKVIV